MNKITVLLIFGLILGSGSLVCGAAQKVKYTTYYPAPYGKYGKLNATGAATDPAETVVFQAKGSTGTGLMVTNDGLTQTKDGLVVQVVPASGTPPAPTSATEAGRIWLDKNVAVGS